MIVPRGLRVHRIWPSAPLHSMVATRWELARSGLRGAIKRFRRSAGEPNGDAGGWGWGRWNGVSSVGLVSPLEACSVGDEDLGIRHAVGLHQAEEGLRILERQADAAMRGRGAEALGELRGVDRIPAREKTANGIGASS